ncbi:molybdenum ABC transporter permease subunit [Pseudodesulfovibrio nedwellii]|uniref:Molybdenum transport system permease n=1 Tax=Pseudodesulfovibrio nedwellii TaxID=2973072 RepID=A0ABN6S7P6_9BACT|nr:MULTISPECIES: molybdate ABC transporter permease subunit [Pseudodesulfovibrio]BDQ38332.1 molybdenum ABC transporter permease subunit [Pseudodesulfovibrio nedwellii]
MDMMWFDFTDVAFTGPLLLTLKVAGLATLGALVLGVAAAYALARWDFPGRDFLDAVCTLPMVMPPTVLGYYLLVFIGRRGIIGSWLQEHFNITLMFTWQGAVIAATVVAFPLVFKSARAALEGVGAHYENAARTLGQGELAVFLRVSLPLAFRGVLSGGMLAFARAMGEFGATLMVAGNLPGRTQTLSLAVYSAVQAGNNALANTLVLIISIVCVIILMTTSKLLKPRC